MKAISEEYARLNEIVLDLKPTDYILRDDT